MGKSIIAQLAEYAMKNNGFIDALIFGDKGGGKSVYALISAYQLYGDWDEALNHLFFDPFDALKLMKDALYAEERIPLIIMDDAGLWLGKMEWWDKRKVRFSEFYNVVREVCACVVFTTPSDDIVNAVTRQIKLRMQVEIIDEKYSRVKIYKKKLTPLFQTFVKRLKNETFPRKIPDDVFERYCKMKRDATKRKIEEMEKILGGEESSDNNINMDDRISDALANSLIGKIIYIKSGTKRFPVVIPQNRGREILDKIHGKYIIFEIKEVGGHELCSQIS